MMPVPIHRNEAQLRLQLILLSNIVLPVFPLSLAACNQGPKSPKGVSAKGGNYHQTLLSSPPTL